jgi:hypothetical protein
MVHCWVHKINVSEEPEDLSITPHSFSFYAYTEMVNTNVTPSHD